MFYDAPQALIRIHELYARWLASDLDAVACEEIHFETALELVAERLYGPRDVPVLAGGQ